MNIDQLIKNTASLIAEDEKQASSRVGNILPDKEKIIQILRSLRRVIFPRFFENETAMLSSAEYFIGNTLSEIYRELATQIEAAFLYRDPADNKDMASERARQIASVLIEKLPEIRGLLLCDVEAGYNGDPAAKSREEIIVSYPGLLAIFVYRVAHVLYCENVPLIPRIMTEYAHSRTGIDINAGAKIGENFFIDHGTGVVIGETTVIGNNVKLYQGVTLGALSTRSGQMLSSVKRHPTIGNDVTVYANATVLGGETVIGDGTIIGGGCFITKSVPAGTKVTMKNPEMNFKGTSPSAEKWEI